MNWLVRLAFFPAAGVTAQGWVFAELFGFSFERYAPLWFCGMLLIYNIDRLRADPADLINAPQRRSGALQWRTTRKILCAISALVLALTPVAHRDWPLLVAVILAGVFSLGYSLPLFGKRLKNLGGLKTFLPALLVTGALIYPALRLEPRPDGLWWAGRWLFVLCLWNVTLCDLRDLRGDLQTGVRTFAAWLGRAGTLIFLWGFIVVIAMAAVLAAWRTGPPGLWLFTATGTTIYLSLLLIFRRRLAYTAAGDWWIDGMLFLQPVLAVVLLRLS